MLWWRAARKKKDMMVEGKSQCFELEPGLSVTG